MIAKNWDAATAIQTVTMNTYWFSDMRMIRQYRQQQENVQKHVIPYTWIHDQ